MVGLRAAGQDHAYKILGEVYDDNIAQVALDSSRAKGGKSTSAGEKQEEGEKKSTSRAGGKRIQVGPLIVAWKSLNLLPEGAGHGILKDRPLVDRGIFGLWAIRTAVGDAGKVITAYSVAKFLFDAFEIKVDERHLATALTSNTAKGKVMVLDSKFQILPPGMEYAVSMANLPAQPAAAATAEPIASEPDAAEPDDDPDDEPEAEGEEKGEVEA